MNRLMKVTVAAAMLFALGGFAMTASAADAAVAKGSVKGKVVKSDGTPAAGAEVRLMARPERGARKAARAEGNAPATPGEGKQGRKARGPAREALAQGTADANGVFTLSDVPEGNYVVNARLKGAGNARQNVSVSGTSAADVTLTLKERAPAAKTGKPGGRKKKAAEAQ